MNSKEHSYFLHKAWKNGTTSGSYNLPGKLNGNYPHCLLFRLLLGLGRQKRFFPLQGLTPFWDTELCSFRKSNIRRSCLFSLFHHTRLATVLESFQSRSPWHDDQIRRMIPCRKSQLLAWKRQQDQHGMKQKLSHKELKATFQIPHLRWSSGSAPVVALFSPQWWDKEWELCDSLEPLYFFHTLAQRSWGSQRDLSTSGCSARDSRLTVNEWRRR